MTSRRQLAIWVVAALGASSLLAGVLIWQHKHQRVRYASFLAGDPHKGAHLFEKKGCAHCHAVGGTGGRVGPDLGFELRPKSSINQLVTAMWNHAPRMWDRMRAEKMKYPAISHEETAHLFAFLYTARYVDEPGEADHGRALFVSKGCLRCHSVKGEGGKVGPELSEVGGFDTPIRWTQAMWNHAPAMEAGMQKMGVEWPKFQEQEMNDLLAYVRQISGGPRRESELLPADAERGWKIFQEKSCIACHSIKGEPKSIGPELGPRAQLPSTIVRFAGSMWNHSPDMWRAMRARGIVRPTFEGQQMADLIAFLYSLRYFEPEGSSQLGSTLFGNRGCARCHGADGLGTKLGPALRGRGQQITTISLAEALWRHGPTMYERTRELGVPWPMLSEKDVGDLVAFLNARLEVSHK